MVQWLSKGGRYFRRSFVFELAMDLYDYKTGVLETNVTHPFIHYACSEAIFRCLSMLPVATVIDQKNCTSLSQRWSRVFVIMYSPKFKKNQPQGYETIHKVLEIIISLLYLVTWFLSLDLFLYTAARPNLIRLIETMTEHAT